MRPQGSARELEQRRLIAGRMFQEGKTTTEIARLLGVTKPAVSNWRKLWKDHGEAGLTAKPAGHRRCLLSPAQKQQLAGLIDSGPEACGLGRPFWTLPLVGRLVQDRFGVAYGPTQLWRLMHELGFSCQRPRRLARQRDEGAIAHWRRHTWPRLKKRPAARAEAWSLSTRPPHRSSRRCGAPGRAAESRR